MALGLIGYLLPLTLIITGLFIEESFQTSVSHFYHSVAGDILVGCLWAIGIFLIAYKSEDADVADDRRWFSRNWDRLVATMTGAGAIGVAIFPVDPNLLTGCPGGCPVTGITAHSNTWHFVSAGMFFGGTLIFCWSVLITRHGPYRFAWELNPHMGLPLALLDWKVWVYLLNGLVILAMIILLGVYVYAEAHWPDTFEWLLSWRAFFVFEIIGVMAFATAWFVKSLEYLTIPWPWSE